MSVIALDTSVAVPLLVQTHAAHEVVARWRRGRAIALAGHAVAETYAVLTRLPGDLRVSPDDAVRLLDREFEAPMLPGRDTSADLPRILAQAGVAGGAVYDALVALAAIDHDATLATRDARAQATYDLVGARVELVVAPA